MHYDIKNNLKWLVKLNFRPLVFFFFFLNHKPLKSTNWIVIRKEKSNCHGEKINAILQYLKKIYLKLKAAAEDTIFYIWSLSCQFLKVKKHFDGNKWPGSVCKKHEAVGAEQSVFWGATIRLCSIVMTSHLLMACPYSSMTITLDFQLAFIQAKPHAFH